MTKIGRLDSVTTTWASVGELAQARWSHNVLWTGNEFLVVGGAQDNLNTETCVFNDQYNLVCTGRTPKFSKYNQWPQVILVEDDYCQFWPAC